MDPFDINHPKRPKLEMIPIRERSFESTEPYDIIQAVIDVVNALRSYGVFTMAELPAAVRQCFHVDYYLAQVANGGHEQYFSNSKDIVGIDDDVREGLKSLDDQRFYLLFEEVKSYVTSSNERLDAVVKRGGFDDPVHGQVDTWVQEKDSEFYTLNQGEELIRLNGKFLRSSGAAYPVANESWKHEMAKIIEGNALLDDRLRFLGTQKKDFVSDLIRNAPLKKSYFDYAQELAMRNGIELPLLPFENWTDTSEGTELWFNGFKVGERRLLVVFRDKNEVFLVDTAIGESGKYEPASIIDKMMMERAEV